MSVLSGKHIVFLGYVWPEPSSSAAGVRTISLVKHALGAGARVSFLSPSKGNHFSDSLNALGVATHETAANDSSFDSLIRKLVPDTVIFDRFVLEEQFGWRVFQACPEALRVVDSQDIHFLRKERERILLNGGDLLFEGVEVLRELSSFYRAHKTLIVSDFEMALLKDRFKVPTERLAYLPLCFEPPQDSTCFADRRGFVFLGNFRHPPNLDGAHWFLEKVFPVLRKKMPNAEVHLYGAYPPKEIIALHAPDHGIHTHGPASDNLNELLRHRVNLAPLRFGAGIKGKIADGWRLGLPSVATAIGAEGMRLTGSSFGGLVPDQNPEAFAEACIALHEEEPLWRQGQSVGHQTLTEKFGVEKNAQVFVNLLATGMRDVRVLERDNLFGRILWWNQHRSTEFFSRWIEEKNRK